MLLVMFLLRSSKSNYIVCFTKSWNRATMTHNETIIIFSQLSYHLELEDSRHLELEEDDGDSKLMQMLRCLGLVKMGHLDSSANDVTKNKMMEKTKYKNKKRKLCS